MNKENGRKLLDWLKSIPDSEWSMCPTTGIGNAAVLWGTPQGYATDPYLWLRLSPGWGFSGPNPLGCSILILILLAIMLPKERQATSAVSVLAAFWKI